jgi:glycosyltransferase involved in cell wall biosynthesis
VASAHATHIVIDGRELVGRPTGVGRYLMGLLSEWADDPGPNRFTVIVPGDVPAELQALSPPISICQLPACPTGTWFEQTALPRLARQLKADVFFAPAYTAPLRLPCPFVVAIYDLSYFAHPEWFQWREGLRRRWFTKAAARRASGVITISEFSASELQRFLGLRASEIEIAPPGSPRDASAEAPALASRPRLVLYAGSIFARRGVPALIEAFADVVRDVPDARLVLVGEDRSTPPVDPVRLAAAAGIAAHVEWRRYAPDSELDALYGQARAFAFLSEYEGFAMTPMEAIARGVPVVLRDTPIAREVYGNGAVSVAPDRGALAAALIELLTDDRAHAEVLARGRQRLGRFSWPESAAIVRSTLERAAAGRR